MQYAPDLTVDTPHTPPLSENGDVFVDDFLTTEQAQEQETKNDEISRKYCARMIIFDELPFNTIEHEGFHDYVKMLQPQFQIPSRATSTRDCMDLYASEFESLKKYFAKTKKRDSLTTHLWSSR
nr:zinc finger BED domain-containing protein RICESLEEPER 2-like [Tanacetum cinerariifolium]